MISEAAASLPIKVFKKSDDEREELTDHPLVRLLNESPNGWQPAAIFKRNMTMDTLLQPHGALAQVVRVGDGEIHEINHLDRRLSSLTVDYSNFEPEYVYKLNAKDTARKIPASSLVHFASPAYDQLKGLVAENRESIALAIVMEQYAAKLFGNGARPSGLLSIKGNITAEGLARVKTAWQSSHGGANQGGTAVLPGDTSWQALSFSSVDSQFLELRVFAINEVARIFKVPPHMLMVAEKNVAKSIEAQGQEFLSFSLLPHLVAQQQELSLKLLTAEERKAGVTIEFDTTHLVKADLANRSRALADAVSGRIMSPNEARDLGWNLPPVDGGDVLQNPYTTSGHSPDGGKLGGDAP